MALQTAPSKFYRREQIKTLVNNYTGMQPNSATSFEARHDGKQCRYGRADWELHAGVGVRWLFLFAQLLRL